MLSVNVDRTLLALGALTISDDHTTGLWIPEDGIKRPAKTWNRTIVTSSLTHGSVETRRRLEQTDTGLRAIYVGAANSAALEAKMDEVEAAFFQDSYPITVTIDGQARTWTCDPADIDWGDVRADEVHAHVCRGTVSVPCHPIAGGGGATVGLYTVAPTVPLP